MNEFTLDSLPSLVRNQRPEWGIVLGSGLGPLVEKFSVSAMVEYAEVPGLPVSTVQGHAGHFIFAQVGGRRIVVAAGRAHLYEGHTAAAITAGVRCLAAMGIANLVLTNAAGTANPDYAPGSWMMLTDHLNLTGTTPLLGGPNFVDMSEVYSHQLRRHFAKVAMERDMPLHEGVYAGLLGPQYETPAEVRMLRQLGVDAIGMSTVLEAIQARALGLEVAGFSCLTNWAAGLGKKSLSHQEVIEAGREACEAFCGLLTVAIAAR